MAKKNAKHTYMTDTEVIGGWIFFAVYLLVMPLLLGRLTHIVGVLLDVSVSSATADRIYYYVVAAVTAALFHRFLGNDVSRFFGSLNRCLSTAGMALVLFYGANELFYRLCNRFLMPVGNLNDGVIAAAAGESVPKLTALIVIALAPFVEEVLFRGLAFGWLAEKSVPVAYAASALLFAFGYFWRVAVGGVTTASLVTLAQYLIPGLVFAWAYGRSGSVLTAVLVHGTVNALAFVM